ncbi:MAG: L,D-transpeptidase family protein [Chlorobiaceae bacterium]|jgi:L,D-transpeptidase YcbB|nr:L,D-transpeptidase family protein [Chlorobiaceae bacterium]NTV16259.1 L,D-transpeptidase family protein [Chlorobiaceae bacterium]
MTGILLFWLAFSPVKPVQVKPAATQVEQHQLQKELQVGIAEKIRARFDRLLKQKSLAGGSEKTIFNIRLERFYAARGFQPVWTKRTMVADLMNAVEECVEDGLDPADYHIREIRELYTKPPATPELTACYDMLMTDSFLTLADHLRYGKVDPETLDTHWNFHNERNRSILEYRLQHAIALGQIAVALKDIRLQHPTYDQLRKRLAQYRSIERKGGWPVIAEGSRLQEGAREKRVHVLRKRLKISGDIDALNADTSTVYNRELVDAVKRFQKRNGMQADGVAGTATLRVMNIPVDRYIDKIRINLERHRWFLGNIEPTAIIVNIPGFTLRYVENGHNQWDTRVIVGKPERETPLFKADMQYIIINPRWVIPPTILAKDALPALRKSASYLNRKKLKIIDQNGRVVDPASVNWSQYSAGNFPYRLQQSAGDHGALGRIKFMLPNKYIVYLHDTPNKELFEESTRTFSSGCVRVENPVDLAALVLQDTLHWNRTKILEAIKTGKTRTVLLPKRVPVILVYLTAVAEGDELFFHDDVYNRDEKLLKALNKPVPQYKAESCGL